MLPAERGDTGSRAFRPVFPLFLAGFMVALASAVLIVAVLSRFWPLLLAVPAFGFFAAWGFWIAFRGQQHFAWDETGFRVEFARKRVAVPWTAVKWYSKRWVSKMPLGSETGIATIEVGYRNAAPEERGSTRIRVGAPWRGPGLSWSSLSFRTGDQLTPFDRYVPERRRDP